MLWYSWFCLAISFWLENSNSYKKKEYKQPICNKQPKEGTNILSIFKIFQVTAPSRQM